MAVIMVTMVATAGSSSRGVGKAKKHTTYFTCTPIVLCNHDTRTIVPESVCCVFGRRRRQGCDKVYILALYMSFPRRLHNASTPTPHSPTRCLFLSCCGTRPGRSVTSNQRSWAAGTCVVVGVVGREARFLHAACLLLAWRTSSVMDPMKLATRVHLLFSSSGPAAFLRAFIFLWRGGSTVARLPDPCLLPAFWLLLLPWQRGMPRLVCGSMYLSPHCPSFLLTFRPAALSSSHIPLQLHLKTQITASSTTSTTMYGFD